MFVAANKPNDLQSNRALLESCVEGDAAAVARLLKLLGHPAQELRHAYQDSIRKLNQEKLWCGLLSVLADRIWETVPDHPQQVELHPDPEHQLRIDESIIELFARDRTSAEVAPKTAALEECAWSSSVQQRYIAYYLFVSRGVLSAIASLKELFLQISLEWQLRTVRLLENLDSPVGGPLLIDALASSNRLLHHEARRALTTLGVHATEAWTSALEHPDSHIRWHAARGLGELGDTRAIHILVSGLRDDNTAVRWATANLLARLGSQAVPAILEEISRGPLDEPARQVTYHALHGMRGKDLRSWLAPLVEALHGFSADLAAPMLAQKMLDDWEEQPHPAEQGE